MARTKIVATIGPASSSPEMIAALFAAGVDVFRLNMSHGDHAGHAAVVRAIRGVCGIARRPAAILCDLSGPKIRIGKVDPPVVLKAGDTITVTTEQIAGTANCVSCTYGGLPDDVEPGQRILLDDGLLEFEVREVRAREIECVVIRGGPLSSQKGLNLPNTSLNISALTDKDRADIEFGLANDADFFAVSFVKRAVDIHDAREFMRSKGGDLPLIAKIEKREAVENIESVLEAADGAMVARGDLGVEIPLEQVPIVQKCVIALCNKLGKPVITATQMLDSMIRSARPTRAEVTDVANAIFDGTDAVMLSGETASGLFPVAAVEMMERVSLAAEDALDYAALLNRNLSGVQRTLPDAISHATASIANELKLKHILCLSTSGSTPRMVARYRPRSAILTFSNVPRTVQQLCLTWGVNPVTVSDPVDVEAERREGIEAQIRKAINVFRDRSLLQPGDRIVVTAGLPLHERGTTNLLRVIDV